jgi:Fe-S-cluster containining protein
MTTRSLPLVNPSLSACRGCEALCCHDLWLRMTPPATEEELASVRWRLHFENIEFHIRDGQWTMRIKGRCRYLGDDSMCTIYDQRPKPCRVHLPPHCQRYRYMEERLLVLARPEDLDAYVAGLTSR